MIKKISILMLLLLILLSIGAVSAVDDSNMSIDSNSTVSDVLTISDMDDEELSVNTHTITQDNYGKYFDYNGVLIKSAVGEGDTIYLDGSLSELKFTFDKKVNIVGTSSNNMQNSMITLLNGASGSSISNLNIANTKAETYGIFLNTASNCKVENCHISNSGRSSYCICLANEANYNNVLNNDLTCYGVTYGHGTRSTPPLLLSGSHNNYVANNKVEADDANGIYLSSYSGGPLNGGVSNFNTIFNNTVHYNVLPTSWSYGIQIMGGNNTIRSNKVIGAYRGVSTAGSGNIIVENVIINLTGADYNHVGVESGGEFGIVGSYDSIVANNTIIGAKVISTGAGITAIDNSVVENNWVNVTLKGRGIVAGGSNVIIRNNRVFTESGSGIYEKDEGSGLLIDSNNVTSDSGVGILIEKLSSKRMPSHVTIINNRISTNNQYAIDASGVQADTSVIDPSSNIISGSSQIISPAGIFNPSKPTYIFNGKTHTITPENIRQYINANGGLTSLINDGDILEFQGTFSNEVIYITKSVKITGNYPVFYNSSFKVTSGNVLIENLKIVNKEAERVNAWGIFVNQAPGVRIINNDITVNDPKAAYAIYVLESTDVDVFNNKLTSEGVYLTFTLLAYASEDCKFINNTIYTIGTDEVYSFEPEKCIDGNELCLDGNEISIEGTGINLNDELCIDGNEECIDGNEFCVDGGHIVSEIYRTYGILLLYSSNNLISGNEVNVTSKLKNTYPTTGEGASTNSIVGIDLYYNSHNNVFTQNTINIQGKDNYIYGMGVLGYYTGHNAPEGQGATNNQYIANKINIEGTYFATGIIVGDESEGTIVKDNIINAKTDGVTYGITLEMPQKSTIDNNTLVLSSEVIYGIQDYSSSDNVITNNVFDTNAKFVYGMILSNANNNKISNNVINANGVGGTLSFKNLDSLGYGNAGIYLQANSCNNEITNNEIISNKGHSITLDAGAINNIISDNYLESERGIGNNAINNSKGNKISDNYKYAVNATVGETNVNYMGVGEFTFAFDGNVDGAIVKLYDANGKYLSQSTVSNGIAAIKYQFDKSYIPAQYIFTAKFFKDNYKASEFAIKSRVNKGNLLINLNDVKVVQGKSTNIAAKVTDEFGNAIEGATVQFNRINSVGRDTSIGSAVTNKNGLATISYDVQSSLNEGVHNIVAEVKGLNYYSDSLATSNLTVLIASVSGGKDYSVYYGNTVNYKVRVLGSGGKAVGAGQPVQFTVNGVTKTIKTDSNGYATYSAKLGVGKYTITANYYGFKVSNKITFKSTLTAKNVVGKKSKTTKFTVKLVDKKGKILKNKKITFKIKNKKYTAKTNSKGVATLSIKNYNVGKYTVTSSYGGCTIKNTITIKK